jgi:hypothetical protein
MAQGAKCVELWVNEFCLKKRHKSLLGIMDF